ncbi:MAG: hypothetical protein AAF494_01835 [Pseudomonadota bacterium]
MGKAKAHPDQIGFDFSAPSPAKGVAELAGLERQINELVGTMLNTDPRVREVIAAEMSVLLDDRVSREMLDAYASPARTDHKVPASRLLALAVVTDRQDLMRPVLGKAGIGALIGAEVDIARIGQLERGIAEARDELKLLKQRTKKIPERGAKRDASSK